MPTANEQLKARKDALISSLFALSKAAQETANATIDFYGSLSGSESIPTNVLDLSSALGVITNSLNDTNPITEKQEPSVTGSAKKRAKRVIDPDAPKKPTTSYFSFAAEERGRVREERERDGLPPLSNAEMTLAIAGRWNALDEKGKEPWSKLYKAQMVQYQEELNNYLAKKGQKDDSAERKNFSPSKTPTKAPSVKAKPTNKAPAKAVLTPEDSSSDASSSSSSTSSDDDSDDSSDNSSDSSDDSDDSSDDEAEAPAKKSKAKAVVATKSSKRSRKEEVVTPSKEKKTVKDQKRKKVKTKD
ncbi:hypothetical protein D0Z00_003036 [Geotrichum galactomycetum]|uniref:Uncharacterized protein n=1 Tax=Geotrichum galactomycetum TaxID=27317 RepID=A0ACB6V2N0_9ASCO|nr:hypothetical protein D0Z00_003036 [Geotrichum candidum]